jgi:excinuclease ABC subunit A
MNDTITVTGARVHNLKNVTFSIPKNKLVVFTGVSGSGKSSMAFDTIYAEGQRRYVESLSSYARQFLGIMDKPDVDRIDGLSPAISIDQKSTSHNPRSTVGTVTEIYDYARLLFARIGHPHCPNCGREIAKMSASQITQAILTAIETDPQGNAPTMLFILSPVVRDRKGEFSGLFDNLSAKGYRQVRVDRTYYDLDEDISLIKTNRHTVDCVIDRLALTKKMVRDESSRSELSLRLTTAVEQSLSLSGGYVTVGKILDQVFAMPEKPKKTDDTTYSEFFSCPVCNISLPELEPRLFSFNSPHGACPKCSGIGTINAIDPSLVFASDLSVSEGGILPFAKTFAHDSWFSRTVTSAAEVSGINIHDPIGQLSDEQKDILLYGTGDRLYEVRGTNRFGEETVIHETYSGIIPELTRRWRETTSSWIREEIEKYMVEEICTECHGTRLKKESLTVTIDGANIAEVTAMSIRQSRDWFSSLVSRPEFLGTGDKKIASPIVKELMARCGFLVDVGLDYLTLDRTAGSLSGGEAQRIRLASQIGSGLSGVLYVLDEPSIGLHQRDNQKLIDTLKNLRDLGNTVIVVEHDRDMMEQADEIVDFGPGAGEHGGSVIIQGPQPKICADKKSVTGQYLSGKRQIRRPAPDGAVQDLPAKPGHLVLTGASLHNLKNVRLDIPLGRLVTVTGVSGSGKSSLIVDTLYPALERSLVPFSKAKPGPYRSMTGIEALDKAILIDQSPIGRTPRSNPATYTGVFGPIREIFAMMPESKSRGYTSGRFSFNVKGGRCEACEGEGQKRIEMQFLSDVFVTCDVCGGTRYNAETRDVLYKSKSIADVLAMTVDEALDFFRAHTLISEKLKTIQDVGLGYIKLGQTATTLSGGEAQRVKLATELSRRATGKTLYILDEPTTGLHFADLEKLLLVLSRLVEKGNTVVVIEHNLDIIKNADWVIDMGPEGGEGGGLIIAEGTVPDVTDNRSSITGAFLSAMR